jgi:hypothetical protein
MTADDLRVGLAERYGQEHDYELLTDSQKAFLLHWKIKDNADSVGDLTVHLKSITKQEDTTLLTLLDHFEGDSIRSKGGPGGYKRSRITQYNNLLELTEFPTSIDNYTFAFTLKDDSKIQVKYQFSVDRP